MLSAKSVIISLIALFLILSTSYIINRIANRISENDSASEDTENSGDMPDQTRGYVISLNCYFRQNPMPLQVCTMNSNIVIDKGRDRESYEGYYIPQSFTVPEHFSYYIQNGSDKFTIEVIITDEYTRKIFARRQIGPYNMDAFMN